MNAPHRSAARTPPTAPPDPRLLDTLRARVHAASGLSITRDSAARALRQRLARRGLAADAYLAALTPAELQQLLELLVVPESWLFRDAGAFELARRAVQARRAAGPGPVRLLVVPCAAGEEAYSLAITLTEAGLAPPQWHLDAVDLSAACLTRARAGWYGPHAFRGAERAFRARHFQPDGHGWRIDPALHQGIHFHQGNLLTLPAPPGGYDIVFCRNLLIYFDAATTAAALARLRALLAPEGLLFAGYAEVPTYCQGGFAGVPVPGAFAVRHAGAPLPDWLLPVGSEPPNQARPPASAGPAVPARRHPAHAQVAAGAAGAASPASEPGNTGNTPRPSPALNARARRAAPRGPATLTPDSDAVPSDRAPRARGPGGPAGRAAGPGAQVGRAEAALSDRHGALGQAAPTARQRGSEVGSAPAGQRPAAPAQLLAAAHAAADRGDLPAAADLCQQVLARAPDTADAYYLLAMATPAQPAAARAELRRCLYLQPDHYPALCQLALLADEDGDPAAAARLRRRAARVHARQEAS